MEQPDTEPKHIPGEGQEVARAVLALQSSPQHDEDDPWMRSRCSCNKLLLGFFVFPKASQEKTTQKKLRMESKPKQELTSPT